MTALQVEEFRARIGALFGFELDPAKRSAHAALLERRIAELGVAPDVYLARLVGNPAPEIAALAGELTVSETYFFRNPAQFRALEDALPALAERGSLRILCAGCATGEEAYSLSIAAQRAGVRAQIRAIDINPAALARAREGRYSRWSLRETSEDDRQRWFVEAGRDSLLGPEARRGVTFEQRNLAVDDPELWQPASYDIVFCRNVVMYFAPDVAQAAIARIGRALVPGGYLFLGHAESLRAMATELELCHTHETFYYRRRTLDAPAPVPLAIPPSESPPVASPAPARWSLASIHELIAGERYADALAAVEALPAAAAADREVLLLHALLLVQTGRFASAEQVCTALLARDPQSAGANYLLGLGREAAGDLTAAAALHRTASFCDPGFAMPRLHLGMIARRTGDRDTARRELGHALVLLHGEDPARLALFGGGFRRDALVALCKAELGR